MMVSISKRSMFYICVASSSYHINNKILRHAGKFPLGLVHQKRPPQVPTKQCFPCILWKKMDLWGPFLGDQPKWKISMTWSFLTSLFPWGFGVLVKSFCSPRSTISKNRLCKANIRMRHWWQWRHWWLGGYITEPMAHGILRHLESKCLGIGAILRHSWIVPYILY